jgi:hypothetical protein
MDMLIKKICLITVLLLTANLLMAETKFFWSLDAGLLVSSSQTDSGVISGRLSIDGYSYKADQEGLFGYGGIFAIHSGVSTINGISLETGIDFCLGNKKETVITLMGYPHEFQSYYLYSSLDIPLLISIPMPISDRFTIMPSTGLYISIPLGKAEYHQEAKVFNNPTKTESYEITSTLIAGFEADVKFLFMLNQIKGAMFFKCGFKYDLNPLYGTDNDHQSWSVNRQALVFSAGYEGGQRGGGRGSGA